jgi:hypothetical protein
MASEAEDVVRFARDRDNAVSVLMLLLGLTAFAAMYGFTYACERF